MPHPKEICESIPALANLSYFNALNLAKMGINTKPGVIVLSTNAKYVDGKESAQRMNIPAIQGKITWNNMKYTLNCDVISETELDVIRNKGVTNRLSKSMMNKESTDPTIC